MLQNVYAKLSRVRRQRWWQALIFLALVVLLIEFAIASISANQVQSTPIDRDFALRTTADRISDYIGIEYDSGLDYADRSVMINTGLINNSRWPRVVMAGLVGAGLALAGNVLQGVFRNPLADPGLIGVSSGAAIGAIIAILSGADLSPILNDLFDALKVSDTIAENFLWTTLNRSVVCFWWRVIDDDARLHSSAGWWPAIYYHQYAAYWVGDQCHWCLVYWDGDVYWQ